MPRENAALKPKAGSLRFIMDWIYDALGSVDASGWGLD
jgi:hypothetical protein